MQRTRGQVEWTICYLLILLTQRNSKAVRLSDSYHAPPLNARSLSVLALCLAESPLLQRHPSDFEHHTVMLINSSRKKETSAELSTTFEIHLGCLAIEPESQLPPLFPQPHLIQPSSLLICVWDASIPYFQAIFMMKSVHAGFYLAYRHLYGDVDLNMAVFEVSLLT